MKYFTSLKGFQLTKLSPTKKTSIGNRARTQSSKPNLGSKNKSYPNDNEINTWISHLPQSPKYLLNQASLQKSILVRRRSCAWQFIDINKTLNNHNSSFFLSFCPLSIHYSLSYYNVTSNLHLLSLLLTSNLHLTDFNCSSKHQIPYFNLINLHSKIFRHFQY